MVCLALVVLLVIMQMPETSAKSQNPGQRLFNINVTTTVYNDLSATLSLSVKLIDKSYITKFSNEKNGEKDFRSMVLQLVYENLAMDVRSRGGEVELRELEVLPNWRASVIVYVPRFLRKNGKGKLTCPYSGTLNFVYMNRVFGYSWNKFTLILPENMTHVFVFPEPSSTQNNVFVWTNGDFIPLIEVTLPSFVPETFNVTYRNQTGTFKATFTGNFTNSTVKAILKRLRSSGAYNLSWSLEKNGTLVVSGAIRKNASVPYKFKKTMSKIENGKTTSHRGVNPTPVSVVVVSCAVVCALILTLILRRR